VNRVSRLSDLAPARRTDAATPPDLILAGGAAPPVGPPTCPPAGGASLTRMLYADSLQELAHGDLEAQDA
jgi:hypothetical protein